jgi:hypothetical protein
MIASPSRPTFRTPSFLTTMNFRLCSGLAAIVCMSLASCHPYNEKQPPKKPTKGAEKTLTAEEQAKLKEQQAKKKAEEDLKKKSEENTRITPPDNAGTTPPPTEGTKPTAPVKRNEYPVASNVPGKEGYVFSPYNNKIICVRDEQDRLIPSGTLVQDPTFPASEKKYFRVP